MKDLRTEFIGAVYIFKDKPDLSFMAIRPGDFVVIKPNLIKECKESDPNEWRCVITSPEIIELVCEHVGASLKGTGRVAICEEKLVQGNF